MTTSPADLIAFAQTQRGQHEQPPGSNVTTYGEDYGLSPAAWCAEFACSYVWRGAGLGVPANAQSLKGWASVGFFLAAAHENEWIVAVPAPGDYACFAWTPAHITWPDHVGIVVDVYNDGSFLTLEGNAPGPDPVGDEVALHHRPHDSTVVAFVRPPYGSAPGVPATNVSPPGSPSPRVLEAPGYPKLSSGVLLEQNAAHHDLVAIYQTRMSQRGWKLAIDGQFGPQTLSITKQFQTEKRLSVDGVVGPQTWGGAWTLPIT